MVKNFSMRTVVIVAVLLVIAVFSNVVLAPHFMSPETHAETIEALDEKKITVMELTAAMVTASTLIAAVPGDSTDPIANQIMNLTSCLMIVVGIVFLEKFLVTVLGNAAFAYIVPAACVLGIIALVLNWENLKNLALKLGIFGLIAAMIIPVSVDISNTFDETYEASIQETIEMIPEEEIVLEEDQEMTTGFVESLISKIESGVSDLAEKGEALLAKGKNIINHFIDAVAVLVITSCVIPVGTVLAAVWLVKLLFGLQISLPKENPIKLRNIFKRK